jgi:DNA-binding transcriptional ArsR family regulator
MVTQALPKRDIFDAIADPSRRAIIQLLVQSRDGTTRLTVNAIAEHFPISRPAISKHVKILREAGLITVEQRGRERFCEAKLEPLAEVSEWVEQYRKIWEERFDRLEAYLKELQSSEKSHGNNK